MSSHFLFDSFLKTIKKKKELLQDVDTHVVVTCVISQRPFQPGSYTWQHCLSPSTVVCFFLKNYTIAALQWMSAYVVNAKSQQPTFSQRRSLTTKHNHRKWRRKLFTTTLNPRNDKKTKKKMEFFFIKSRLCCGRPLLTDSVWVFFFFLIKVVRTCLMRKTTCPSSELA